MHKRLVIGVFVVAAVGLVRTCVSYNYLYVPGLGSLLLLHAGLSSVDARFFTGLTTGVSGDTSSTMHIKILF